MKIEILFPEVCNLFGEIGTINYLKKIFKDETIYETELFEKPKFLDEDVDFVFLGPSTESIQEKVIELLTPYKNEIDAKIQSGVAFLVIGNSLEIFGNYIDDGDKRIECLGIFDVHTVRNMNVRHNEINRLKYKDLDIVGVKSQFTQMYPNRDYKFMDSVFGKGLNEGILEEGIKYKNFYGTYIIGPLLLLNPEFTKLMFKEIGYTIDELPFESLLVEAHEARLGYHNKEYKDLY